MPDTTSIAELLVLGLLLAVGGAVTGILAGLFGIGGGTVIVPVLYQLFDFLAVPEAVRMHLCIGTSLAAIIPTSYRSYRAHKAKGAVDPIVLRRSASASPTASAGARSRRRSGPTSSSSPRASSGASRRSWRGAG